MNETGPSAKDMGIETEKTRNFEVTKERENGEWLTRIQKDKAGNTVYLEDRGFSGDSELRYHYEDRFEHDSGG